MAEFWGDETAIARQKRLLERQDRLIAAPWLASGGRLLFLVDLGEAAWKSACDWIEEEGLVVMIGSSDKAVSDAVAHWLGADWRVDFWRAYFGKAAMVNAAATEVIGTTYLPDGWTVRSGTDPSDADIEAFQKLNAAAGVSPSPAAAMRSGLSVIVSDAEGAVMAVAWVGMFFHPESAYGQTAFCGLVAVDTAARGMGLGKYVNAVALRDSQALFGWAEVTEFVAADNLASIGMVTGAGLTWDGARVAAIASRGAGRFTR